MYECNVAGERLIAMPERSVYWPAGRTLFAADLHLGKAEAFRAGAVPVPSGTTDSTLARLDRALAATGAGRLALLGDLWHARAGKTERIDRRFLDWRAQHPGIEVLLVEGNHDLRAGRVPPEAGVREVAEPYEFGPFALRHHPEPTPGLYALSGHLHPAVRLEGRGGQALRLPCFWFGQEVGVLPAFGDFTGSATVCPRPEDQVLVIPDGRVVRVR